MKYRNKYAHKTDRNRSLSVNGEGRGEGNISREILLRNKLFVNDPVMNNIKLVGRPTKIKWKIHALFRPPVVNLSFTVMCTSKDKALFCSIKFDYYEKFCREMFFFLPFFFRKYEERKKTLNSIVLWNLL